MSIERFWVFFLVCEPYLKVQLNKVVVLEFWEADCNHFVCTKWQVIKF